MLSEMLFEFNQLTRCFKSALTSLFTFLIELLRHKDLEQILEGRFSQSRFIKTVV